MPCSLTTMNTVDNLMISTEVMGMSLNIPGKQKKYSLTLKERRKIIKGRYRKAEQVRPLIACNDGPTLITPHLRTARTIVMHFLQSYLLTRSYAQNASAQKVHQTRPYSGTGYLSTLTPIVIIL